MPHKEVIILDEQDTEMVDVRSKSQVPHTALSVLSNIEQVKNVLFDLLPTFAQRLCPG